MGIFGGLFKGKKGSGGNSYKKSAKALAEELEMYGYESISVDKLATVLRQMKEDEEKRGIVSFVSDFERVARGLAQEPLRFGNEKYAEIIAGIFRNGLPDDWKDQLRPIGEEIDDNHLMMLVALRAEQLCQEEYQKGNAPSGDFSVRYLEIAWNGIAGWMA